MTAKGRKTVRSGSGRVTGWQGSDSYFRMAELDHLEPGAVLDVLRGDVAGVVVRGFLDAHAGRLLAARFLRHPLAVVRSDDAAGRYLGAYSYGRSIDDYLDETERLEAAIEELLGDEVCAWDAFRSMLRAHLLGQGVRFRRAEHGGRRAALGAARHWTGDGSFALVPHEDRSQCCQPAQAGFEIQRATEFEVCAANLCLVNGGGGRLAYWNVKPDDDTRQALGTWYSGGPYPDPSLSGIDRLSLDVNPGDLYVFNGAHVHAVEQTCGPRVVVSSLLAFVAEDEVVTWT